MKDKIALWETEHGRTFLVNGMSFLRHVEKTWLDHEEAKQREKDERVGLPSRGEFFCNCPDLLLEFPGLFGFTLFVLF